MAIMMAMAMKMMVIMKMDNYYAERCDVFLCALVMSWFVKLSTTN